MKKLKYIVLILVIFLSSAIIYLFMPLSLEIRHKLKDDIPDKIIVTIMGVDNNGIPQLPSIEINDKDTITEVYQLLKEIKLSKSFKSSKHSNQYLVKIVNFENKSNPMTILSLTSDLIRLNYLDYKIVNSQDKIEEILDIFENKFQDSKIEVQ